MKSQLVNRQFDNLTITADKYQQAEIYFFKYVSSLKQIEAGFMKHDFSALLFEPPNSLPSIINQWKDD